MRLTLVPTQDPRVYDDAVRSLPITSPLQGWGYGEARRTLGQEPLRFLMCTTPPWPGHEEGVAVQAHWPTDTE